MHHEPASDPVTKAMMGAAVDAVAGQSGLTTKQAVLQILVGKMGLGIEWAAANMSRLQDRVGSAVRRQAARKRKRDAQPGGAAAEEQALLSQPDKSSSSSDDDNSGGDIDALASTADAATQHRHRNYITAADDAEYFRVYTDCWRHPAIGAAFWPEGQPAQSKIAEWLEGNVHAPHSLRPIKVDQQFVSKAQRARDDAGIPSGDLGPFLKHVGGRQVSSTAKERRCRPATGPASKSASCCSCTQFEGTGRRRRRRSCRWAHQCQQSNARCRCDGAVHTSRQH